MHRIHASSRPMWHASRSLPSLSPSFSLCMHWSGASEKHTNSRDHANDKFAENMLPGARRMSRTNARTHARQKTLHGVGRRNTQTTAPNCFRNAVAFRSALWIDRGTCLPYNNNEHIQTQHRNNIKIVYFISATLITPTLKRNHADVVHDRLGSGPIFAWSGGSAGGWTGQWWPQVCLGSSTEETPTATIVPPVCLNFHHPVPRAVRNPTCRDQQPFFRWGSKQHRNVCWPREVGFWTAPGVGCWKCKQTDRSTVAIYIRMPVARSEVLDRFWSRLAE